MRSMTGLACSLMLFATAACGSDEGAADPTTTSAGGPTTSVTASSSTSSTTSTTAATTASSTSSSTTTTTEPRPDGVRSPEDAAVLVITSWVGADFDTAARHATPEALDTLFATDPPSADAVEFVECDSSDLVRFDCFFAVDGAIVILGVVDLRVTDTTIDSD